MIKNKTKKTIIAKDYKICNDIISKAFGLMFSKPKPLILIFKREKIIPLHMLFVFYPIDVLFLDKEKRVVEIKENLKPFSFYTPKKKAMYAVELPSGSIKSSKTKFGDFILFKLKK